MIPPGRRVGIVGARPEDSEVVRGTIVRLGRIDGRRREVVRGYVNLVCVESRPTAIVSGGALGVDTWAIEHARERHGVPVVEHRPEKHMPQLALVRDDDAYRIACMKRNDDIVNDCDWVVAFPGAASVGTWDTIRKAIKAGKLWEVRRG